MRIAKTIHSLVSLDLMVLIEGIHLLLTVILVTSFCVNKSCIWLIFANVTSIYNSLIVCDELLQKENQSKVNYYKTCLLFAI